jgi:hypothetical protein
LKNATDEKLAEIAADITAHYLMTARLNQFYMQAASAYDENVPSDLEIDHHKSDNPYKSHYSEDWELQLKDSYFMKSYV